MKPYIFGEIIGVNVGDTFLNRRALVDAGIHRNIQAGISGNKDYGCEAIVLSGGYVDDLDLGEAVIYTGQGGRDPNTGKQIANQELSRGNAALVYSSEKKKPIRVIRGSNVDSPFSPDSGYRYDGLYFCTRYWATFSVDGPLIWRFLLTYGDVKNSPFSNNEELDL
jgi:putative restriction endonuclease